MLPASNRGAGMNIGFPDICLVPAAPAPIPTPFPNMAMNAQAVPFAITVWISMMNALSLISMIPMTSGDEAGSASPIKGAGRYTIGNIIVFIELMPGICLLCPTTGNNMINALGAVLVPSIVTVFYTDKANADALAPSVSTGALDALAADMETPAFDGARLLTSEIGYLRIRRFTVDLPTDAHASLTGLEAAGARAFVLDLRGCPGGELDACVRFAEDFLERGAEICSIVEPDGDETTYRVRSVSPYRWPLVLLVDSWTASAAELFAGALQAHGRALILGERTHGKGTVQALRAGAPGESSAGAARYLTTGTCLLPGGVALDGRGVEPDEVAEDSTILDAAVAALLGRLAA
ncbi:MAG: S41 family peptidase [Polyangiaceae bacterium]